MPQVVQRLLVIVLTLALLGASERYAFSDNNYCPLTFIEQHVKHSHAEHHHHHGQTTDTKHNHSLPCCTLCAVDVTLADTFIAEALLTLATVAFPWFSKTYTDRPVLLDPGIPKRIA
jgi:hypothetical protein